MTTTKSTPESNLAQIKWMLQEFLLWNMNRVRDSFGGDIDSALILGEIAHHNRQMQFVRSASEGGASADTPLSPANIRGISRATGIPRETVRRKVQRLSQLGWLRVGPAWQLIATPLESPDHEREVLLRFLQLAARVCSTLEQDQPDDARIRSLLARLDGHRPADGAIRPSGRALE